MSLFNLLILLSLALMAISNAQMLRDVNGTPGGWSKANAKNEEVVRAAKFAVHHTFPNLHAQFYIVTAMKQVVAGMKYELLVQVTPDNQPCSIQKFQVWDRFGELKLVEAVPMPGTCVVPVV